MRENSMKKSFPSFDSFSSVTNKALKSLKCFYKVHSAARGTLELEANASPRTFPPFRGTERALTNIGKSRDRERMGLNFGQSLVNLFSCDFNPIWPSLLIFSFFYKCRVHKNTIAMIMVELAIKTLAIPNCFTLQSN